MAYLPPQNPEFHKRYGNKVRAIVGPSFTILIDESDTRLALELVSNNGTKPSPTQLWNLFDCGFDVIWVTMGRNNTTEHNSPNSIVVSDLHERELQFQRRLARDAIERKKYGPPMFKTTLERFVQKYDDEELEERRQKKKVDVEHNAMRDEKAHLIEPQPSAPIVHPTAPASSPSGAAPPNA